MATITLHTIARGKALARAKFLEDWAAELRETGDCDLHREACTLESEADEIRHQWE